MLNKILPGWLFKRAENDEVLVVAPNGNGSYIANKGSLPNRILHQLACALVDGSSPTPSDSSMRECSFNFARQEGAEITTLGTLGMLTTHASDHDAWQAFLDATTQWVATTEAGRNAWNASSQDLNIGDMATSDAFQDTDFQRLLSESGLIFRDLHISDAERSINYDKVLVDESALEKHNHTRQRG